MRITAGMLLGVLMAACGDDSAPPPPDAATLCTAAADCDDGDFCNGEESCDPTAATADTRGCVAAAAMRCMPGQECREEEERCLTMCDVDGDADDDGIDSVDCGGTDCDDSDGNRFPGNAEICDAADHDEDCDARTPGFRDSDGDAHSDALCCNVAEDTTRTCGDDCDDLRPDRYTGLVETCDGADNDCDTNTDEMVLSTYWPDADLDGYGSEEVGAMSMQACTRPTGYAETMDDCDDRRGGVHPGAVETCDIDAIDEDCDDVANPPSLCMCSGDISRGCLLPGVCAAGTERCVGGSWGSCSIAPRAETCNTLDDDCDGTSDETLTITCYLDADDDSYSPAGSPALTECPVSGRGAVGGCRVGLTNRAPAAMETDCNDARADVFPLAAELCDAAMADENCNGMVNEGCKCADGSMRACPMPGACASGTQTCASGTWGFCSITPRGEICNLADDDCDAVTDEMVSVTCYADGDSDGYAPSGATSDEMCACTMGYTMRVPTGTAIDCDDTTASRSPVATEVCNGADEDCDSDVDEELPLFTRYVDADGDTREGSPVMRCSGDPGSEASSTDCNELDATIYVGAPELCDRKDNNCSSGGTADLAEDMDNDMFSPIGGACMGGPFPETDCNDTSAMVRPGVAEVCDGLDNNCAMGVDEEPAASSACSGAMATTECVPFAMGTGASCLVVSCTDNFADCDGTVTNGCEINVSNNINHCGTCGLACGAGGTCTNGECDAVVQVSGGDIHTCAVRGSGGATCWGGGSSGRLGNGMLGLENPTAQTVMSLTDGVEVAAGGSHTCVRRSGGSVSCFGYNNSGQLGIGVIDGLSYSTPQPVMGLTNATEIAANFIASGLADAHTCAVRSTGAVACWGDNAYGQLGNGSTMDSGSPVAVMTIAGATAVAVGGTHTCAIAMGSVYCWGRNNFGQLGANPATVVSSSTPLLVAGITGATSVAAGAGHTCAVHGTGSVSCWGQGMQGQLGHGMFANSFTAVSTGITDAVSIKGGGGNSHTCVRRTGGAVSCWGSNFNGQLGDGTMTNRNVPTAVSGIADAVQLDAGSVHSCALRSTGRLLCWGDNTYGRLGDGTITGSSTPRTVIGLSSMANIEAGGNHTCGRRTSGETFCWGRNMYGELGVSAPAQSPNPLRIAGLDDAVEFDMGWSFTCARRAGGRVACFGRNDNGQLGDGTMVDRTAPTDVMGITTARDIVAGLYHACARLGDGTVRCWGDNGGGQLGDNTFVDRPSPVTVMGLSNAVELSATIAATCARVRTGEVYCWGSNNGEFGDGTTMSHPTPTVPALVVDDTIEIVGGFGHTCVRRANRLVYCFGRNVEGQLGDGTTTDRTSPVLVSGLGAADELMAESNQTCARIGGNVYCWGENTFGQLGDGTVMNRNAPVAVSMLSGAQFVGGGSIHTCAMTSTTGGYRCWGGNVAGQLGNGNTMPSSLPVTVLDLP